MERYSSLWYSRDIATRMCWVFRIAERSWEVTGREYLSLAICRHESGNRGMKIHDIEGYIFMESMSFWDNMWGQARRLGGGTISILLKGAIICPGKLTSSFNCRIREAIWVTMFTNDGTLVEDKLLILKWRLDQRVVYSWEVNLFHLFRVAEVEQKLNLLRKRISSSYPRNIAEPRWWLELFLLMEVETSIYANLLVVRA